MNVRLSILLALLLSTAACSSSGTRFTGMWLNEDYKGTTLDDVLVIAAARSETNRRMFESELVGHLERQGVNAAPSYVSLTSDKMLTKEEVEAVVREQNFDAVIVTRLVDVDREEVYVPPTTYVEAYPSYGYPYYGSYYGYYSHSYSVVHDPGYTYENVTVSLETNLYDASNEALVWSGQSATFNPGNVGDVIGPTTKLIVSTLVGEGLISPK